MPSSINALPTPKKAASIINQAKSQVKNREQKLSTELPSEIPNEIVESQTRKIPNLAFLGFAGAAMVASAMLTFKSKHKTLGNFVGLWVPTMMLLGVYNKIVKVEDEVLVATKQIKDLH